MSTVGTSSMLCRLCLNKEELIYVYDERLANGHQLRMCILLCTGVQIEEEDSVSKMVCHKCCSLAVKLFQYRQMALANDKALKEIANEPFNEPLTNKDAILEMHSSILENISQCKVSENVAQVYRVPLDDISEVNNEDKVTKDLISDNDDSNNSAHATVKEIFQYFPTTAVPREILDSNVLPSVPVDKDIKNYVGSEYEVMPADNSDGRVLKFKRKYPATDVVKISVKKPRKESYNSYSSDSDCSVPPVFKSRKKHPNPASDASYSDCDSDSGDEGVGGKLPLPPTDSTAEPSVTGESTQAQARTNTRPSRSKVSKNPLQFPDSDSDNEVAKKPANTKYCAICDRTFWGWSQLKSHQRTHLRCVICRIICDSQEDLEYHVKNICYKNMEYNQPILLLPKVDENPFMLHIYRDAFERYFQDIEDGVYGPTEPPPPPDPDYPFYHDEERVRVENEFIGSVFEKFKHLDNTPVVRNKVSQTRRAETHIKYYSRNQIILEDMYQDLNMYKVPINVIVSPRVSAHLSFATKPVSQAEPFEKWSVDEVIDIVVPQKDPTYFLRPKKPPPPKNAASVVKKPVRNEKHPKLLKALTSTTAGPNQTTASTTTTSSSGDKTKSYNIAKLLSTTVTTPQQNTSVPKSVSTVAATALNQISQLRLPTRISSEVSLVPKSATLPKTSASISTNFRLPILTQSAQSPQQRLPPPRPPPILPQQHSQLLSLPYIKEEPELTPQSPVEMSPHIQPIITPSHRPPAYSNMFRLPAPPIHNQHNQNELYLKQEKDIEDNLSYASPSQYSRPNINYQNHSYRMPLSKPASHVGYNHQPVYPAQQLRYRVAERKTNALMNNQQYYNTNHHQNGMRYRSVSGGSMMVLPNSTNNQNGGLLNQIPPPPTNLNSMPATHLLQSMNHMSNTLTHHSPLSHAQQNQVNSVYNQPTIGKMSPISSVPSPLHSIPSPIETKPLSSPINSMPSPLSNYNTNSYNTSSNLYDHTYSDSFSNNSYSDSFSASYLQPQPAQQYIPPYSPHNHMEIDPFVDQMLQQAAGSNNNKTALRVKQPWELNQT